MPRFRAPNHKDCWIDCPGAGSAIYYDPPGECVTQCGEEGLAVVLARFANDQNRRPKSMLRLDGQAEFQTIFDAHQVVDSQLDDPNLDFTSVFGNPVNIMNSLQQFSEESFLKFTYVGLARHFSENVKFVEIGRATMT